MCVVAVPDEMEMCILIRHACNYGSLCEVHAIANKERNVTLARHLSEHSIFHK